MVQIDNRDSVFWNITSITVFQSLVCFFLIQRSKRQQHSQLLVMKKNLTLSVANNTSFAVVNNTVTTEENDTDKNKQWPSTVNHKIILCIQIFGCVDIFLICTYSAWCFYDRQHRTPGILNTYENIPGNNSTNENAGIFFLSGTGNQLLWNVIVINFLFIGYMFKILFITAMANIIIWLIFASCTWWHYIISYQYNFKK